MPKVKWHDNPAMLDTLNRRNETIRLMALSDEKNEPNYPIKQALQRSLNLLEGLLAASNKPFVLRRDQPIVSSPAKEPVETVAPTNLPEPLHDNEPVHTVTPTKLPEPPHDEGPLAGPLASAAGDLEVSEADYSKLQAVANKSGKTMSQIIETAVKEYLARNKV